MDFDCAARTAQSRLFRPFCGMITMPRSHLNLTSLMKLSDEGSFAGAKCDKMVVARDASVSRFMEFDLDTMKSLLKLDHNTWSVQGSRP